MQLSTNAPAHWPPVSVATWDAANTWNNAESVAIALDQGFIAAGTPCPILLYASRLHDDGVLEVPIQVTDQGRKYCVFLFGSGSAESAAAFASAREFVEADGATRAVYYSPEPLADSSPGNAFGPFRTRYIAQYENPTPAGQYAMWWATPGDEEFTASKTLQLLDSFYRACDGIETLVLGDVLHALGKGRGARAQRTLMPDQSVQIAMCGPEEHLMLFAVSGKGLRFLFAIESTDTRYRDRFWRHVGDYARRFKNNVQVAGGALDPEAQCRGLPWWESVNQSLQQRELSSPIAQFGLVHVLADNHTV
jgi:hypothetical protein